MIDSQDPAMLGFAGLCKHKRGESEGDKGQSTEFGVHQKSSRDAASLLQVLGLFGYHASWCVFADQPAQASIPTGDEISLPRLALGPTMAQCEWPRAKSRTGNQQK